MALAKRMKASSILTLFLAEVSKNPLLVCLAKALASSIETERRLSISDLFPIITVTTSSPEFSSMDRNHFLTSSKDLALVMS